MQQKQLLTSLPYTPTSIFQSLNKNSSQPPKYQHNPKETQKTNKTHLWKQLVSQPEQQISQQSNIDALPQLSLQARSISQNSQYEQQSQDEYSLPIQNLSEIIYKKQQFPRISNFLQNLHVHTEEDGQSSRFGTDSQIISIMDIKYSEFDENSKMSGLSPKLRARMSERITNKNSVGNRSQFGDKKFQIILLFQVVKQVYNEINTQVKNMVNMVSKQYQNMCQLYKQLTNQFQTQINLKNQQIQQITQENVTLKTNNLSLTNQLLQYQSKFINLQTQNKLNQSEMIQKIKNIQNYYENLPKNKTFETESVQDIKMNKPDELVETHFFTRNKAKTAQYPSHSQFVENCSQSINSTNISSKQLHGRRFQRTKRYHSPINSPKNCHLNHVASFNKIDNPPGHDNEQRIKIMNLGDSLESVYIEDKIIGGRRIGEKA